MRNWLLRGAIVVAVFASAWIVTILVWRARNQMPGVAEILVFLVALPTAILAAIWAANRTTSARQDTVASTSPTGSSNGSTQAPASANDTAATLAIVGSALRVAHGSTTTELKEAVEARTARADLDPELTDTNGFPVMSFRVSELDEDQQKETLDDWQASHGLPPIDWQPEHLRALQLGTEVVTELAGHATAHPLLADYLEAAPAKRGTIALPSLKLVALFPTDWEKPQRDAAGHWLLHQVEAQGWPADKLVLSIAQNDTTLLAQLDQLALTLHRQQQPYLCMVIACGSNIGEQTVHQWESTGTLFNANNAAGRIPGEGAAGMLLADSARTAQPYDIHAILHRIAAQRHDHPTRNRSRIHADLLARLTGDALKSAGVNADQVELVAADTGHLPNQLAELMETGYRNFPDLDLQTQCQQAGIVCGEIGAVASLVGLCLAADAACEGKHAVFISNNDDHERAVAVITPLTVGDSADMKIAA